MKTEEKLSMEDLLDQHKIIQDIIVMGVLKVREGLLDISSGMSGTGILGGGDFVDNNGKKSLFRMDNDIRGLGSKALADLASAGRKEGINEKDLNFKQSVQKMLNTRKSVQG